MKNIKIFRKDNGFYFEALKDNGFYVRGDFKNDIAIFLENVSKFIESVESKEEVKKRIIDNHFKKALDGDVSLDDLKEAVLFVSKWSVDKDYKSGDLVSYGGRIYKALKDNKSSYETLPAIDDGSLWQKLDASSKLSYEIYNHEKRYKKGEGCSFNGKNYKLIVDSLEGESPFASPAKWEEV